MNFSIVVVFAGFVGSAFAVVLAETGSPSTDAPAHCLVPSPNEQYCISNDGFCTSGSLLICTDLNQRNRNQFPIGTVQGWGLTEEDETADCYQQIPCTWDDDNDVCKLDTDTTAIPWTAGDKIVMKSGTELGDCEFEEEVVVPGPGGTVGL